MFDCSSLFMIALTSLAISLIGLKCLWNY